MWSKWIALASVAAACVLVVGCGGGSDEEQAGADEELRVQLAEQDVSAQSGTATFTPLEGGRTRIVLELTNPSDVSQPAHVHSGTCDDLGDAVVALVSVEGGRSETETDMSVESLQQGGLVIHAHKSAAESDISVACAPIEEQAEGTGEDFGY
ncbi:MAG: hypothetical protein ACRDNY_10010 [Gaiellaceae bacterium]